MVIHVVSLEDCQADKEWIWNGAAELLESQWPRYGVAARLANIKRSFSSKSYHFAAVSEDRSVVGHAQVRKAHGGEATDGISAVIHSVVVDPHQRRKGIGRQLCQHAEAKAASMGFAYVLLSTTDQQQFYKALGYELYRSEQVYDDDSDGPRKHSVSRLLHSNELGNLQSHLLARARQTNPDQTVDFNLIGGQESVWLRKALCEVLPPQPTNRDEDRSAFLSCISRVLASVPGQDESRGTNPTEHVTIRMRFFDHSGTLQQDEGAAGSEPTQTCWSGTVLDLMWERQVGPSCGLAALRILRRHLSERQTTVLGSEIHFHKALPSMRRTLSPAISLLKEARERGLSCRGEMFDADALAELAEDATGWPMKTFNLKEGCRGHDGKVGGILDQILKAIWRGWPVLVAYDRDRNTHLPITNKGHSAHWAIMRGLAVPMMDEKRVLANGKAEEAIVLLAHSMARAPVACPLPDLVESNLQLFAAKETVDKGMQVVPRGGPRLKGRFIVPTAALIETDELIR